MVKDMKTIIVLVAFVCSLCALSLPNVFAADVVTIVCEDDFAPYGYQAKNGGAAGLATDIIVEAYKAVGVSVVFKVMPYARCMAVALSGGEVGCYNTNNDEKNLANYIFPEEPLFIGDMVFWARKDYAGEVTVEGLIGSREVVGVTHGYNYDAPGVTFDYEDKILKDSGTTVTKTLQKLVHGRYNIAAAERRVALLAIARSKEMLEGKIKVVGTISRPGLFLSFSKSHPDGQKYANLLTQGIRIIKANGKYAELEQKWDALTESGELP